MNQWHILLPHDMTHQKNIIFFVGNTLSSAIEEVRSCEKKTKLKFRFGLIQDSKITQIAPEKLHKQKIDISISCDLDDQSAIQKALIPYQNQIFSVTTRGEYYIPLLAKVVPHIPYIKNPTSESLLWATDKLLMRRRLYAYNKKISPAYTVVPDTSQKSLKKIEEKIGFPMMAKPSGLAASKYVSLCFHKDELKNVLDKLFKKMQVEEKKHKIQKIQKILVEQFMEGDMYSVDCYVNGKGKVYFCPMVAIKTGNTIGFDDFFGYRQITPTLLGKKNIEEAHHVSTQAIHALALRNTTVHIELMKMEDVWKVIELSPRIGGFRSQMYAYSYGIDHSLNDILIHAGKKPVIPIKRKGYTVAMKFFAKKEGRLSKLKGIKKIEGIKSLKSLKVRKKIGDYCSYAKNGGDSVINLIMFHEDRSKLLADIRRVEQMLIIETHKK